MLYRFNRRTAIVCATLLVGSLISGCGSDGVTGLGKQRTTSAARAAHDDDPATCKSGYTLIDGHVVCNPEH